LKHFEYTIDAEISIMEEYKLNPNELFVLKCILLLQETIDTEEEDEHLLRYLQIPEEIRGDIRQILISLQNKGIILKSYVIPMKGQAFDPAEIQINKSFIKKLYRGSIDMGRELLEAYPMFRYVGNSLVSMRGFSKKFNSMESFSRFYGKTIRWNPETHKQILELLRWEEENNVNFINFSLATFVIEQKWIELEALKEGKIANVNFDTIKSL